MSRLTKKQREKVSTVADELRALYDQYGALDPAKVVAWARKNPGSSLHKRFNWDDGDAAEKYRLWQAREVISSVQVVYQDGKKRQAYVAPRLERTDRKEGRGYSLLVEVLNDVDRRKAFLNQALTEYEFLGKKYDDLKELASVRKAVTKVKRT